MSKLRAGLDTGCGQPAIDVAGFRSSRPTCVSIHAAAALLYTLLARRRAIVNRWFKIAALALLGFLALPARAQDHHPLHKDFYHHWRAPDNPATSCCNARIEKDGREVGDCEPTQARIVGGNWQAWVRQWGVWIPIPEVKILREKNPNIFDGHLCWTPDRGVICFVPPNTGG